MDIQCLIEEAWTRGDQTIDMSKTHLGFPYVINFSNLTQRSLTHGYIRNVRRVKQAPYPLVKIRLDEMSSMNARKDSELRKSTRNINQASTKTIANTNHMGDKKPVKKKNQSKGKNGDTTPANLARAFLHNLNIFGSKSTQNTQTLNGELKPKKESLLDADSSSTRSGRRPSLDTVSTYLSQESRESHLQASHVDLLNCSASSDDGNTVELNLPSIIGKNT